jgi:hypothetical protein
MPQHLMNTIKDANQFRIDLVRADDTEDGAGALPTTDARPCPAR